MSDINKVWLSGVAISLPTLTKLPPNTPFTTFLFQVNEYFNGRNGEPCQKSNIITIESLGKAASVTASRVSPGGRFQIEGYLRVDDGVVRVRTFAVYKEESHDAAVYSEGLRQAIEILERSRDKNTALEEMRKLVDGLGKAL